MAVKKCCIKNCKSCSTRKEDKGVTYHKFPKDVTSRNEWQNVTHYTQCTSNDLPAYVCSRHFCKVDFLKNKDCKYILKPDAVPSIFPWTLHTMSMDEPLLEESQNSVTKVDEKNMSSSSKGSDIENLDAIKRFIEEQEKEIQEKKSENETKLRDIPGNELDIKAQEIKYSEKKPDIVEQVEQTTENNSGIEEEVNRTAENKSHIKDGVKQIHENNSDIVGELEQSPDAILDIEGYQNEVCSNEEEEGNHILQNKSYNVVQKNYISQNVSAIKEQETCVSQNKYEIENHENKIEKSEVEQLLENGNRGKVVITNVHINEEPSVLNFIHSQSEPKTDQKMFESCDTSKQTCEQKSPVDKGNNSMPLSVGSKVEVKDFGEEWYPAEITEVDYDEMEVLVRYEIEIKKSDEWISVSSPRLRPFTGVRPKPPIAKDPDPPEEETTLPKEKPVLSEVKLLPSKEKSILKKILASTDVKEEPKEDIVKIDEKPKLVFEVGERCLARWRDNRRFVATISKDLGEGKFEVIFDDGVHWTCGLSRLHKMKAAKDPLTVDTSLQSATVGSPSPLYGGADGSENPPISPALPIFHTHLFDPSRDYLCSKSERRERKRKLNIKEIFNIGQKKYKSQKTEKETTHKAPVEKKPRIIRKNVTAKVPRVVLKKEIKLELPDALTSIIGTKGETGGEINEEPTSEGDEKKEKATFGKIVNHDQPADISLKTTENIKEEMINMDTDSIDSISCVVDPNDETLDDEDTEDQKSEDDPVLEEEVKLANFEKQDTVKHEAVIHKMKEAINKLEDGIYEIEKSQSPKVERALTPKLERAITPKMERALTPMLEGSLAPKLERALTPILEKAHPRSETNKTPKSEHDIMNIDIPAVVNDKPQDLKDVLAEVVASIDIGDSSMSQESSIIEKTIIDQPKVSKSKRDPSMVKKTKKLRLLQEKKVKKQVEKVKNELELMKKQFEAMRTQMMVQSQGFSQGLQNAPLPESCLLPGEWCCRWVNGQPVGKVSEIGGQLHFGPDNKPVLPRRSVQVEDKRLPAGWARHMVRRSEGHSAGKWDVVLVGPEEHGNKRFHNKLEMRNFLEICQDDTLKEYQNALFDFGVHLKTARRMGWITNTPDGIAEAPETILPADTTCHLSPLVKKKNFNLKRREDRARMKPKKRVFKVKDKKRRPIKLKLQKGLHSYNSQLIEGESSSEFQMEPVDNMIEPPLMPLEDGYVYVGSLKVQIIENLLRCPAEGCVKNFRTKTLLQMHIKHYHRELITMMGATPKVLDLAYARTMPNETEMPQNDKKVIKVKINKPPKREESKLPVYDMENSMDGFSSTPGKSEDSAPMMPRIPRSQDSPKLRQALVHKPVRRPRVLLPVRRLEPEQAIPDSMNEEYPFDDPITEPLVEIPVLEHPLDFETAISTHTVTKPSEKKKKGDKKKSFASFAKHISEDEEWFAMNSDELDTRSSFPRSGSPDSKMDSKMAPMSSESNDDQKDPSSYTYTETGERIKIVHMRREEIINCHCGVREEDGLMVQCELCLCWQHALCHNIQKECEVPEKYTCSICLNPRLGRRSMRFVHDQDRLYEGLLPGARPSDALRRAHELAGNLLRLHDALHALRVKQYVATKKDHPKLYLWASDWEQAEISHTQEKLNSDYSDLNIMINGIDKENLPVRRDSENEETDSLPEDDPDSERLSQRDNQLGSQALLSGLLSSPGGASLDLHISTSELERLAKSVQESGEWQRAGAVAAVAAPQPEAAIENEACRARLLLHVQRCHALLDSRLDSIEAQVAELESQDPSFGEHYETAEYYPRTKQTIQMLMRDLDTMEELGVIT